MFDLQIETPVSHRGQTGVSALVRQALASLDDDPRLARDCLLGAEWLLLAPARRDIQTGGLAPWQVKRACAYIEAHLDERMPLWLLAQQVRLSTSAFSRSFRQSLGLPPQTYVRMKRIERAQHLMVTSDMRLCEIAIVCGFSDQAHFSRIFSQMTSATPARWRREMVGLTPRTSPRSQEWDAYGAAA